MSKDRKIFRLACASALAALLATATAPGFGSSKAESKPEAAATPEPRPHFELGPSLKGRYDLTVLLGNDRVDAFQFAVNDLRANIGRSSWMGQISLVLEFGAGTGVAECEIDEIQIRETIRLILLDQQGQQLLTTAGKLKFKQELIAMINASLKSARVRQVYFTEFAIMAVR